MALGVVDKPNADAKESDKKTKIAYIVDSRMRIEACFGVNVRILRKKRHFTQTQLAERCGFHQHYISEIENGQRNVTLRVLEIIAVALGVHPYELLP